MHLGKAIHQSRVLPKEWSKLPWKFAHRHSFKTTSSCRTLTGLKCSSGAFVCNNSIASRSSSWMGCAEYMPTPSIACKIVCKIYFANICKLYSAVNRFGKEWANSLRKKYVCRMFVANLISDAANRYQILCNYSATTVQILWKFIANI